MKAVFDTNILVDYLNGLAAAKREFDLYEERLISVVTWMEILVGAESSEEERITRDFLSEFEVKMVDFEIAERSIKIRRDRKIKLPDAIIWATAIQHGTVLVTRNTKDFSDKNPGIRVPYKI